MGDLSEFSKVLQLYIRGYRWRRIDPVPWTPLSKPLSECRIALISSAGLVAPEQDPFDDSIRGGDVSFREIPAEIEISSLRDTHRSDAYDHSGIQQDPNLAFPLAPLQNLCEAGRLGSLNHRHFSFMGSITAPGRLVAKTAPPIVAKLVADEVDVALLVPV
jgi:D-proline reductase (dithiol) PrdB